MVSSGLILLVHTNASISPSWNEIAVLFKKAAPFHIVGIASGFADRIDRIAIAWFLPLGVLGKYGVGTSLLSYLRFLPEALSRLIISGQSSFQMKTYKLIGSSLFARLAIGVLASSILAAGSQLLVRVALGKEWLIPSIVVLGFAIQEFIRGYFQLRISTLVALGRENAVFKLSVLLIALSAILSLVGVNFAGLIGVPIGIAITYLVLIFLSYKNLSGVNK